MHELLARAPDDRDAQRVAAEAWLLMRRLPAAEQIYRKLLAGDRGVSILGSRVIYQSALGWICRQTAREIEGDELLAEAKTLELAAVEAAPLSTNHLYSMAATCSASGQTDEAMSWLEKAATAGMIDHRFMALDPRLAPLAPDPRFQTLLSTLQQRVEHLRRQGPAVTMVSNLD